jgi:hypothetical protein
VPSKQDQDALDEALVETFPASDPEAFWAGPSESAGTQ